MGKTESLASRGLFRRFSSRRSKVEPALPARPVTPAPLAPLAPHTPHTPHAPSLLAPTTNLSGESIADTHARQQRTLPSEGSLPTTRMTPVDLPKPVSMVDSVTECTRNVMQLSMVDRERRSGNNRAALYTHLPHVGNTTVLPGSRLEMKDSAYRQPVRRRSRAMEQLLKERVPVSPSAVTKRNVTGTTEPERVPPPDDIRGLRRKQSLSPAATDYVSTTTTPYSSKLNRRKALLIGIGYRGHKHLHPLPGCKNDVRAMFELLTSELFGFREDSMRVLSDELETLGSARVEPPTRYNILQAMHWLTEDVHEGDSVVFFFAGHGDFIEDVSGDEVESGVDQCIMPVDFMPEPKHMMNSTFKGVPPILDDTIYERLVRGVPSGAKVTAIVDACRSGSVCDLPVMHLDDGVKYRPGGSKPPRERRTPHKAAGGFVLFSGSADDQQSVDMTVPKNGQDGERESFGLMTRSFVDAAREMAWYRCPQTYDGVEPWTYGQLFDRVKRLVRDRAMIILPQYIEIQEPQMSTSHEFDIWSTSFSI